MQEHERIRLNGIARRMSAMLLKKVNYKPTELKPVPVEKIARFLCASVFKLYGEREDEKSCDYHPYGELMPSDPRIVFGYNRFGNKRQGFVEAARILIYGSDLSESQLTLAHELGHWINDCYFYYAGISAIRYDCPNPLSAEEYFAEEFGCRLVLPDELLLKAVKNDAAVSSAKFKITIPWIKITSERLKVPPYAILRRLNNASEEKLVKLGNCGIAAGLYDLGTPDQALRVGISCVPLPLYIPIKEKLSQLGFLNLEEVFWNKKEGEGGVKDKIVLKLAGSKDVLVSRTCHYLIYNSFLRLRSKKIITVFNPPKKSADISF